MSELEQMGKTLMETALNFTHPRFEATYPEWGAVCNIGEELVRMSQQSELNENQQIVLEWLKEEKEERCSFESAIYWYFEDDVEPDIISDRLTQIEFLQVLQAFAEWGMKEVAE